MKRAKLIYKGGGFLPGVPARDLTAEEVERYGGEELLIGCGLYEQPAEPAPAGRVKIKLDEEV